MPTPESYKHLTEDELRERLALAEAACVLSGWAASRQNTPGEDAATQAWMEWAHHVGSDYCSPRSHPDLNERRIHELATDRCEIRERTLASIRDERGSKGHD